MKRAALIILILTLVFTLFFAVGGCSKGKGGTTTTTTTTQSTAISPQELASKVSAAIDNVQTAQYRTIMTGLVEEKGTGAEAMSMTVSSLSNQATDMTNRKAYTRVQTSLSTDAGEEQGPTSMQVETYIIGDTIYSKMEIEGQSEWYKQTLPEVIWEAQQTLNPMGGLLDNSTSAKMLAEEKVDGVNCYVVDVTVDPTTAWNTMMQQPGISDFFGEALADISDMISSMSVKEWIATDTSLPAKAQIKMVLLMTPETLGIPSEEGGDFSMTMDMNMETFFYGYDQPVTIELPAEAANAIEMPETGSE